LKGGKRKEKEAPLASSGRGKKRKEGGVFPALLRGRGLLERANGLDLFLIDTGKGGGKERGGFFLIIRIWNEK